MKDAGTYDELARRLESLLRPSITVFKLGEVVCTEQPYPLYMAVAGDVDDATKNRVLLSGGVHGSEPAGALAVTHFLEHDVEQYLDRFSFVAFPCVNPSGFDHGTLRNADGLNLNRQFKKNTRAAESRRIMEVLNGLQYSYLFTMDHHETSQEDVDPTENYGKGAYPSEYYLYESARNPERFVGSRIVAEIRREVPVCNWDSIAGDLCTDGVVYGPQPDGNAFYAEQTSFDGFLFENGFTDHSFTVETPRDWEQDVRIATQLKTLELALKFCAPLEKE